MKNPFFCILFFVLSSAICFASAQEGGDDILSKFPYKRASYTQKITMHSDSGVTVTYNNIKIKDGMARCDTLDGEKKPKQTAIVRDGYVYVTFPGKEDGIKNSVNPGTMPFISTFREEAKKAEKTGEAVVAGEKCGVYEYAYTVRILFVKMRFKAAEYRNKDGFVMKSVTTEEGKEGSEPDITEIIKLDRAPLLMNASDFEVDRSVKYADYSELTKGMAAAFSGGNDTGEKAAAEASPVPTKDVQEEVKNEMAEEAVDRAVDGAAGAIINGIFGR